MTQLWATLPRRNVHTDCFGRISVALQAMDVAHYIYIYSQLSLIPEKKTIKTKPGLVSLCCKSQRFKTVNIELHPQCQCTDASYQISVSQQRVINVKASIILCLFVDKIMFVYFFAVLLNKIVSRPNDTQNNSRLPSAILDFLKFKIRSITVQISSKSVKRFAEISRLTVF